MRACWVVLALAGCGGRTGTGAGPLTLDQVEAACVAAYSCTLAGDVGRCIRKLTDGDTLVSEFRPEQIRCLAGAGSSCVAARACIGIWIGAPCSGTGESCIGTKLRTCAQGIATDIDCAGGLWHTPDTTCIEANGYHQCGLGTCSASQCVGDKLLQCSSFGIEVPIECAPYKLTCGDGTCSPPMNTPMCTATHCEGTTLVRCSSTLHENRFDCAAMFAGGTCIDGLDSTTFCGFANECSNAQSATCNGDALSLCVLGKTRTFDCIGAGYARCSSGQCAPTSFP